MKFINPWYNQLLPNGSHFQKGSFIHQWIKRCRKLNKRELKTAKNVLSLSGFDGEGCFQCISMICQANELESLCVYVMDKDLFFEFKP